MNPTSSGQTHLSHCQVSKNHDILARSIDCEIDRGFAMLGELKMWYESAIGQQLIVWQNH